MSYANLLGSDGKILGAYLPASSGSGVQNPMTADLACAGYDINNVSNIRITDSIDNTFGPLTLTGTANTPAGYTNPTVLVGGGSVLQTNGGLVVSANTIPGSTKVASIAGDVELTGTGELFCTEINTTSSANVNYLTITEGAGAEVSCNSIATTTSNDLCLIVPSPNKVFTCSGPAPSGPYYRVANIRGSGIAQLGGTGSASATISVSLPALAGGLTPGVQASDIIQITPVVNPTYTKQPSGVFYVGPIDATAGTFEVFSTQNADFNCAFYWCVYPAM